MKNEQDKTVVDLNPDEFVPKKKSMNIVNSFPLAASSGVKYCYFSQFVKIALRQFSKQ